MKNVNENYNEIKTLYQNEYDAEIRKYTLLQMRNEQRKMKYCKQIQVICIVDNISMLSMFPELLVNSVLVIIHNIEDLLKFCGSVPVIKLRLQDDLESILQQIDEYDKDTIMDNLEERECYYCLYTHIIEKGIVDNSFFGKSQYLLKNFIVQDIVNIVDDYYVFVYSDKKEIQESNNINYIVFGGYGDLLIQIPLFYCIEQRAKKMGIKVKFLTESQKAMDLFRYFFPDADVCWARCSLFYGSNNKMEDLLASIATLSNYKAIPQSRLNSELINSNQIIGSYFEIMCNEYKDITGGLDAVDVLANYHKYFSGKIKVLETFDRDEYKYWICVQRSSSTTDLEDNKAKEIPVSVAEKLIRLCHKNGIGVVNIDPDENGEMYDLDFGNKNLVDIMDVLIMADAFVGVDSCFGHACGLLNIPSITCLGSTQRLFQILGPTYRPISKNYALIPSEPLNPQYNAEKIFCILYKVLEGKLILCDDFVPTEKCREFSQYEYI